MRKLIALHFLCLLVFVAHAFASRSPALASGWKTYTNARFGYSISYPADVLMPQGESDNGDGQKFLSRDGRGETPGVHILMAGKERRCRMQKDSRLGETHGRLKTVEPFQVRISGCRGLIRWPRRLLGSFGLALSQALTRQPGFLRWRFR